MTYMDPRPEGLNTEKAPESIVETLKMPNHKTVTFDARQYQLVPKVPTEDMVSKAQDDAPEFLHGDPWYGSEEVSDAQARAVYAAMLAAAPTPAAQSAGQEAEACSHCGAESAKGCIEDRYCPLANAAPVNGGERETYEPYSAADFTKLVAENAGLKLNVRRLEKQLLELNEELHVADLVSAADAQQVNSGERCVCGQSTTLGTVHRTDGPCYVADAQQVNGDLHGEIMNIRCTEPEEYVDAAVRMAYRVGHRDARHAAAELVCMEKARAALSAPVKVGGDERDVVERMARAMNIATDGHDRYWSGYVKSAEAAYRAALSAEGGETLGQKKAAFLKHEGAVETGVMLRAENRIALVTYQGRVEWYDANEFGGIQLSADGGEDKRDAERYRWLVERFVGYDFDWMPSEPDAADGASVAVFEIGREFRGSRDITASIDDHRAAKAKGDAS